MTLGSKKFYDLPFSTWKIVGVILFKSESLRTKGADGVCLNPSEAQIFDV
jgi:hypothetical protein